MKGLHVLLGLILALFSAVTFAQMVDINTATADQLEKGLKGIGPAKAAAIVKYRQEHGAFQSVDDLGKVPGVGDKTLLGVKASATVGGGTPALPSTSTLTKKVPTVPATSTVPGTSTLTNKVPTVPATPTVPGTPAVPAAVTTPVKPKIPAAALPKQ
jgi:competence protein ComEA